MKLTIEFEPEDIRSYYVAEVWTDSQVAEFIERWQPSFVAAAYDALLGSGGLLESYMADPDCIRWVTGGQA